MSGALVYGDYLKLIKQKKIIGIINNESQIQPSSVDLSLSNECYEISTSFLSLKSKVRDKLKKSSLKKMNLKHPTIFKKNKTYIVKLNEKLNLNNCIRLL